MMRALFQWMLNKLDFLGTFLPQLGLRVLLAWEFWESGIAKYQGENWFITIQDKFPFPLNILPTQISWFMATWFELIGAIALLIGLGTRLWCICLMVLTIVAIVTVHMPMQWNFVSDLFRQGYDICDSEGGNFKLPLIYLVLFLPLLFNGAGKFSIDYLLWSVNMRSQHWIHPIHDIHK